MDAYQGILGLIRSGEMAIDAKVTEATLAARLGVSRTPVREALRVLDSQRLVISQGRGVRVRVPGDDELAEAFQTRCALESYAAQVAAQAQRDGLIPPVRLREVRSLAAACDEATRLDGAEAGARANRVFHLSVAALAGNHQIIVLLTSVWDQILIATRAGLTAAPRITDVHAEHGAILQAVTDGLPDQARIATTAHIESTLRISRNGINETRHRA